MNTGEPKNTAYNKYDPFFLRRVTLYPMRTQCRTLDLGPLGILFLFQAWFGDHPIQMDILLSTRGNAGTSA